MIVTERIKEIWVTFGGVLDVPIIRTTFDLFHKAYVDKVETIHILMHSPGGGINEGVGLYNYFRSLPMEIVAYNAGTVASAAVTAYLGATKRIVAPTGAFLVHKTVVPVPNVGSAARLQAAVDSIAIDDERTEAILREHINLTDSQWTVHGIADLTLSASESIQCGLAHEIGYFAPAGPLFNI